MYYEIGKALSYNCLFNFIVGMRGVGKTYAFKRWAIQDFLKNKNEFIYIRRYKTEVTAQRLKSFFDDIQPEFPNVTFKVKGNMFYINDEYAGQAQALSTGKILKSIPFPKVSKICFDEFILDKGVYHYLQDEVTNFLELYSTIARLRDVIVFFLSNAYTISNPYFDYFNIVPPYGNKTIKRINNEILVEVIKNEEYTNAAMKTRFGSIINGTAYGKYNMENDFLRDNKNFVQKKTQSAKYYFTILYMNNNYGIWIDYKEGLIFVSRDIDESCLIKYALTNSDLQPNMLLAVRKSICLQTLRNMYNVGAVRYESVKIKNEFSNAFKLIRA